MRHEGAGGAGRTTGTQGGEHGNTGSADRPVDRICKSVKLTGGWNEEVRDARGLYGAPWRIGRPGPGHPTGVTSSVHARDRRATAGILHEPSAWGRPVSDQHPNFNPGHIAGIMELNSERPPACRSTVLDLRVFRPPVARGRRRQAQGDDAACFNNQFIQAGHDRAVTRRMDRLTFDSAQTRADGRDDGFSGRPFRGRR